MPSVKIKRGTRAQVTSAAASNGLAEGELYLVTDESRVDVGTAANASTSLAKKSEVPSTLNDLTDVTISSPTDGQALVYDSVSGVWVNQTVPGGGGGTGTVGFEQTFLLMGA